MKDLKKQYPDVFADDNELYPDYASYVTFADALVSEELEKKFIEQLGKAYGGRHHTVFTMGKTADSAAADFRRKVECLRRAGRIPPAEDLAAYREAKLKKIASAGSWGLKKTWKGLMCKISLPGDWQEKRIMLSANTREELAILLGGK